jgi:hypothetical protein
MRAIEPLAQNDLALQLTVPKLVHAHALCAATVLLAQLAAYDLLRSAAIFCYEGHNL